MKNKQEILGQYFTNPEIVDKLLNLIFEYKNYQKDISVLEPSFGTGNFVRNLVEKGYSNITGYEIDKDLTDEPANFFDIPLENKYDLVVGNPPFSKYNLKESYFHIADYIKSNVWPASYLTKNELTKEKDRIENAFILKSLRHLKDANSSIGFVLPISFFIKNKNKSVKHELASHFSTVIIYQNDKSWFDRNIPCCFAIFTNIDTLKDKIVMIYENGNRNEEVFELDNIYEELIPQVVFHKNNGYINNNKGLPLKDFLDIKNVSVKKSFITNNVSAKNILEKREIPKNKSTEDYKIAVVRVGNSSVGKCGLINIKEDTLNDMFYIFDVQDRYKKSKQIKEAICNQINANITYFRNITCRVGSKSIKKEDIFNFRVAV